MYILIVICYMRSKSGIAYTFLTDEDTEVNSRPIILLYKQYTEHILRRVHIIYIIYYHMLHILTIDLYTWSHYTLFILINACIHYLYYYFILYVCIQVMYDLKEYLEATQAVVPQQLQRHPAAQVNAHFTCIILYALSYASYTVLYIHYT